MRVAMIGTGYVGLVSGACFADFGHVVTCIDKDPSKIERLEKGEIPIFEPGLDDVVKQARGKNLFFSTDVAGQIKKADIIFVAVNTPTKTYGVGAGRAADLRSIENGLRAQGVKLTAEEILQLELALDKQEAAATAAKEQEKQIANQRAVYEQVYGPGIRYREMLEALRAEYDRGALSSERYAFEVRKLQDQYNQTSGGASLTEGFQQQAQKVAQQNQEALDGLVQGLTDVAGGFFNLSEQAHKSFGQMAADAAAAAAKILVEFAILQGLRAVFGGDSGVASVASQIFFGGNRAAGGTFVAPNGGGGGVDSVPVLFRTTPGEHITFTPPGQSPPGQAPPQVVVPVSVNNGISHDMIAAALDTPAGHTAVFNVIERYVDQIASRVRASS